MTMASKAVMWPHTALQRQGHCLAVSLLARDPYYLVQASVLTSPPTVPYDIQVPSIDSHSHSVFPESDTMIFIHAVCVSRI